MKKVISAILLLVFSYAGFAQEESLQDILARAEKIGPVQYEVYRSCSSLKGASLQPAIEKFWQKSEKIKYVLIIGNNMIPTEIIKPDARYFYLRSYDKYEKISFKSRPKSFKEKTFMEVAKELLEDKTLKILGNDIIDGKATVILEFSNIREFKPTPSSSIKDFETIKTWIWKEKGIPLRQEIEYIELIDNNGKIEEAKGRCRYEYKNFIFGDIPDSVFEVPKDKITESSISN
jgi:outer membrane lipoprotein-sorting protein